MKKLLNAHIQFVIEQFSTIRIVGPYTLLQLGPDFAEIQVDSYHINFSGIALKVDMLTEELALFSCDELSGLSIRKMDANEMRFEQL